MQLDDNAKDAVTFLLGTTMGGALLDSADEGSRKRAVDAVTGALRPHQISRRRWAARTWHRPPRPCC